MGNTGEAHWRRGPFLPPVDVFQLDRDEPFLPYSICHSRDFLHPKFAQLCAVLGWAPDYRRKLWEWVKILDVAKESGAVGYGTRALGFGVGAEPLTGAFAELGADVVATDAPASVASAWAGGDQYAGGIDAIPRGGLTFEDFARRVAFRECDMNDIPSDLTDFDFCWSSCALEHLGSLEAGLDFLIASVEKTLRPGGIACHTTEFNCSSNGETVETGPSVLYRRRDIEKLIQTLRRRGHYVADLRLAPIDHWVDSHVDLPPYGQGSNPHLKLELEGFVSTSLAIVVRRGAP